MPNQYDSLRLIQENTLLPLYQLFQPTTIIKNTVKVLRGEQYQAIHTKLGKNASRVKSINFFRFCPNCWEEQMQTYGEVYWKRHWQITGYEYCTKHKQPLFLSSIPSTGLDRKFYLAHFNVLTISSQLNLNPNDLHHHIELTQLINELLTLPPNSTIENFSIISDAYFAILKEKNLLLGTKNINYEKVHQTVIDYWGETFLQFYNLDDLKSENCWLKNICRKHRKSFSYLEHLILLKALFPDPSSDPINEYQKSLYVTATITPEKEPSINTQIESHEVLSYDQLTWIALIKKMSVQAVRLHDGALYARLYRKHKNWLLKVNHNALPAPISPAKPRVNWSIRDREFIKQLIKIRDDLLEDLNSPQWTTKFFIKKLGHVSLIEKNWHVLPLTKAFLNRYAESTSCYQIRRLTRTYINQATENKTYPASIFLRLSGLSLDRLTPEAHRFFITVMGD